MTLDPLSLPYKSQWALDAGQRQKDCGPTCVAMLAEGVTGQPMHPDQFTIESDPSGLTTAQNLVDNLAMVHIPAKIAYLAANEWPALPAICLVLYQFDRVNVWDKGFFGWHWLVLLAHDANGVTVHDPDFLQQAGAFKHYSAPEWARSFQSPDGNGIRQAVILDMSQALTPEQIAALNQALQILSQLPDGASVDTFISLKAPDGTLTPSQEYLFSFRVQSVTANPLPPPVQPATGWVSAVPWLNVRTSTSATATKAGQIDTGVQITYIADVVSGGYQWAKLVTPSQYAGKYVALEGNGQSFVSTNP